MLQKIDSQIRSGNVSYESDIHDIVRQYAIILGAEDYGYAVGVNEVVAHRIDKRMFRVGDVISIDTWFKIDGIWIDAAITSDYMIAEESNIVRKVKQLVVGAYNNLNTIFKTEGAIYLSDYGRYIDSMDLGEFKVIKSLSGHDITDKIHGGLRISNTFKGEEYIKFECGKRYALETLINSCGDFDRNTWASSDLSVSAHWELTVDMTANGLNIIYGVS